MGATLEETLAEANALSQEQQRTVPPQAVRPPAKAQGASPASPKVSPQGDARGKPKEPGMVEKFISSAIINRNKVVPSVAAAVVRAPGQLAGGTADFSFDAGRFIGDSIDHAFARTGLAKNPIVMGAAQAFKAGGYAAQAMAPKGASLADVLSLRSSVGKVGIPALNQFATEGIATMAPVVATGGESLMLRASMSALGGAVGMNSEDGLKGRAKNAAIAGAMELGGEAVIRGGAAVLKRVIKTGTPAEAAGDALDRAFAARRTEEARGKAAEASNKGEPLEADPMEKLPNGTRHSDSPPVADVKGSAIPERSPEEALVSDANKALEHSGAPADLTPETLKVDPTGKVIVDQASKDAADEAGFGRAFTATPQGEPPVEPGMVRMYHGGDPTPDHDGPLWFTASKADAEGWAARGGTGEDAYGIHYVDVPEGTLYPNAAEGETAANGFAPLTRQELPPEVAAMRRPLGSVIFKEEAEDGSSRIVGSMGREDLQQFAADVARLQKSPHEIDLPDGSPQGQWSMAHLGADYDAPAVLRAAIDTLPPRAAPPSTAEIMEAAGHLADTMGSSPEEALAFVQSLGATATDMVSQIKAAQTISMRYSKTVMDKVTAIGDIATATEEQLVDLARSIHDVQMFATAFQPAKAGTGRTLRIQGLPDSDTFAANLKRSLQDPAFEPPPADPGAVPPLPRTRDEIQNWVDLYGVLDPAGRQAFLEGTLKLPPGGHYLRTSIANAFVGAILSAPKTIALNVIAPAIMGTMRTIERSLGAGLVAMNPLASQAEREVAAKLALQGPVSYVQTISDVADAFRFAIKAHVEGEGILGAASPLDKPLMNVPPAMIRAATAEGQSAIPYHLGNLLNWFPTEVWRFHGSTNEFAERLAYMGEVRAKAMLEASQAGLEGPNARALVQKRLGEATNMDGSAADLGALDSAQRTTMVRTPNPDMTPNYAKASNQINGWRTQFPELRFALPVFQVPANGLGEAIRRIPGVNVLLRETQQELSGSLGVYRQAEAHGRYLLGGGLLLWGTMQARTGQMTGAGPSNPRDRALWLQTHQPYSMKIGGQWVEYSKMEPAGTLLGIVSNMYDHSVHSDMDQAHTLAGIGALAQYFKDKSSMQAVADLMNLGTDPQDQAKFLNRLAAIPAGFIPAFVKAGRNIVDPYATVKRGPWDFIKDALPGASKDLDPVRNPLGEAVYKPQNTAAENLLPVTMTPVSTAETDLVMEGLSHLYEATGYAPGAKSPALPGGKMDMRDVKLENGQSLYDGLMQRRSWITVDGSTLRQTLSALFTSPEYAQAVDGDATNLTTDDGRENRGALVSKVFQAFDKAAVGDLARSSDKAAQYLAAGKIKATNDAFLNGDTTEDIVRNPALLEGLGINFQDYVDDVKGSAE